MTVSEPKLGVRRPDNSFETCVEGRATSIEVVRPRFSLSFARRKRSDEALGCLGSYTSCLCDLNNIK